LVWAQIMLQSMTVETPYKIIPYVSSTLQTGYRDHPAYQMDTGGTLTRGKVEGAQS